MLPLLVKTQVARFAFERRVREFIKGRSGATAIEYGLIAAGIAVAIIVAVFALGDELENFFTGIQTQLKDKQPG